MPRVPQYEEGQVRQQNLPSAGFSAAAPIEAFGGGAVVRGLQDVGQVVGQIATQEREKAETAQLLDADRQLSAWEIEQLHAPETGALNRRGRDALDLPDKLLPDFDNRMNAIAGKLSPPLRDRFMAMAQGRRNDVQKSLFRHVAQQGDVILKAEADAYEATALAAIAANAADPERVAAETDRLWAAKFTTLTRMGATEEVMRAERAGLDAKVHATLLDQYLAAGQYDVAVAYYDKNREALGQQADEYGRAVREAKLVTEETRLSDEIIASVGPGPSGMAQARKIQDPVLRERVESRLDRESSRRDRLQNDYERVTREQAWAKIEQAAPTDSVYDVLSPKELAALSAMPGVLGQLEARQNTRLNGLEVKTDPRVFDQLHRQMAADPAGFRQADLTPMYDKLSPADRDYFIARQAALAKPDQAAEAVSESRQLDTYVFSALGIPASGGSPAQAKKRGEFWMAYEDEKRAAIAQNGGKPLTDVQRRDVMQRLMLPMVREGLIFDDEAPAFQVPRGQEAEFKAAVPAADRAQIIESYERNLGRPPTEIEIGQTYQRKQTGN